MMEGKDILHIAVISVLFAIVKMCILYFVLTPVFNFCWEFNCKLFGLFGIESKTVLGIIFFLFTCISPAAIKIALMMSDWFD